MKLTKRKKYELHNTLELAKRTIEWYGCNVTEQGKPHPQQLVLDEIDKAMAGLHG